MIFLLSTLTLNAQKMKNNDFKIEGMTMAVTQMDKMLKFYSNVFQVSFVEKDMFNSKLYAGQWSTLNLLFCPAEIAQNTANQNRHQFDVVVDDLKSIIDLATENGGKVMGEISENEFELSIGIYDPDRNSILFKQYKK